MGYRYGQTYQRRSRSVQIGLHLSPSQEAGLGLRRRQELPAPISNLTVISKLLERLVARQLLAYLSVDKLLPDRQSFYQAFRSTETAIAGLLSDILSALDTGDIAALAMLDLSAAFDTVDHTILLQRLQTWATALSLWPVRVLGTLCLRRSVGVHHLTFLNAH